uniref:Uncharacterized protein n=1 Tax=Trieres chinensis TaxID=1514140 RepID=A0A7S2EPN4_TRICV|eukprot:CAMPEP_0183299536 /NCGR_PEP_ID=MMETSP0160_2-20130417/6249_1 /TAXON_ID=2839 ORGANISM="Odontella Sinensis, Strain Grunow 1884" /NCGR_SAMPLE_ID=MMETSP0160_2 /ASSEMBLY_ACC=CAM_ASM_000250 /LENGTH=236 /DNA_ID=CAMNT_0025461797 /DNA_START=47 /DNA_END=757 /DNA_ORIENTATION=-
MTGSEILKIAGTVAVVQAGCDILARRFVFSQEPYQRALSAFERARTKRDKIVKATEESAAGGGGKPRKGVSSSQEKNAKKIQRAEDDCAEAAAEVARRHTQPTFFSSLAFIILYRILSAEHAGRVIAVMPFQPWGLVRRLSMRGITIDEVALSLPKSATAEAAAKVSHHSQACAFLFVYVLCTLSVKFMVNKLLGTHPPQGADGGVGTILDAPKSQRMLKSLGVDTDELKEARKAW